MDCDMLAGALTLPLAVNEKEIKAECDRLSEALTLPLRQPNLGVDRLQAHWILAVIGLSLDTAKPTTHTTPCTNSNATKKIQK